MINKYLKVFFVGGLTAEGRVTQVTEQDIVLQSDSSDDFLIVPLSHNILMMKVMNHQKKTTESVKITGNDATEQKSAIKHDPAEKTIRDSSEYITKLRTVLRKRET